MTAQPDRHPERLTPELRRRLHAQALIEGRRIVEVLADAVEKYLAEKQTNYLSGARVIRS